MGFSWEGANIAATNRTGALDKHRGDPRQEMVSRFIIARLDRRDSSGLSVVTDAEALVASRNNFHFASPAPVQKRFVTDHLALLHLVRVSLLLERVVRSVVVPLLGGSQCWKSCDLRTFIAKFRQSWTLRSSSVVQDARWAPRIHSSDGQTFCSSFSTVSGRHLNLATKCCLLAEASPP
ncbi:hypothetical protein Bbelb_005620 [Branchiostoma belcheri]|nr:hypothetical protein Bbelb_005620 [Branchiostoma belcheri]